MAGLLSPESEYFTEPLKKKELAFRVYYLYDDEALRVRVEDAPSFDFAEVLQHLLLFGSVFITTTRVTDDLPGGDDDGYKVGLLDW